MENPIAFGQESIVNNVNLQQYIITAAAAFITVGTFFALGIASQVTYRLVVAV